MSLGIGIGVMSNNKQPQGSETVPYTNKKKQKLNVVRMSADDS